MTFSTAAETEPETETVPPYLPAEIWRNIFAHVCATDKELVQLWRSCRQLSRLFKEESEFLVAAELVPRTSLRLSSGESSSFNGSKSPLYSVGQMNGR